MDILIKNMEMPKGCTYEDNNGKPKICFMFNDCDLDRSRCPLVALPEHGDLKDMADIQNTVHKFFHGDCFEVCKLIRKFCPTIVEATK